jgi:threonyl-tRNA synthetase
MQELAARKVPYVRETVTKDQALNHYRKLGNEYKVELINDLEDGQITFYHQGNFTDLCRGPHLPNTGYIKAIKLLSVAGAYWRGNEKNRQLTRIYGISFPKQSLLDEYLVMLEQAKQRDHRKIGRELELFTFSPKVGQGLPMASQRNPAQGKAGTISSQSAASVWISAGHYSAHRSKRTVRYFRAL